MTLSAVMNLLTGALVFFVTLHFYNDWTNHRNIDEAIRELAAPSPWITSESITSTFDLLYGQTAAELSALAYCNRASYLNRNYTGILQGFIPWTVLYEETLDVNGFVGYFPETKHLYIVFRGADKEQDIMGSLDFAKVPYFYCNGCEVHQGFLLAHEAIISQVFTALLHAPIASLHNVTVVVTGHSLGGATATLTSVTLKKSLGLENLKLITFGSPRVFNKEAAINVSSLLSPPVVSTPPVGISGGLTGGPPDTVHDADNSIRMTHYRDIVPHFPPKSFGYQHITTEWYESQHGHLKRCNGYEDSTCADQWMFYTFSDHRRYLDIRLRCPDHDDDEGGAGTMNNNTGNTTVSVSVKERAAAKSSATNAFRQGLGGDYNIANIYNLH